MVSFLDEVFEFCPIRFDFRGYCEYNRAQTLTVAKPADDAHVDLAIAWSSILIFDSIIFGLTLLQALRQGRMWSHSLFHLILRDGNRRRVPLLPRSRLT